MIILKKTIQVKNDFSENEWEVVESASSFILQNIRFRKFNVEDKLIENLPKIFNITEICGRKAR